VVKYVTDELYLHYEVLTLNVARLDAEWSKDWHLRVGPGGTGDGNPKKYQGVKSFMGEGAVVCRPIIHLKDECDIEPGDACFTVANGRHRIAVLRDMGESEIEVVAPRAHAAKLRELFG
jgi:hypothetical protein